MPRKGKSEEDKKRDAEQATFEKAVKAMRDEKRAFNLVKSSAHFNYGKDPQKKNSDLGKRKVLPRFCSDVVNPELKKYIPDEIAFDYCVLSKGQDCCCFGDYKHEYKFDMAHSFNLSEAITQTVSGYLPSRKIVEKALVQLLIAEKNRNSVLRCNGMQFYVRTIGQDALSTSMESRQNVNRISYAPAVLVRVSDGILMRIRGEPIGVGYCDLPNHKVNTAANKACSEQHGCIHRIIHIHKKDALDVQIDFGFKKANSSDSVVMELQNDELKQDYDGRITLFQSGSEYRPPLPFQGNAVHRHDSNNNNNNIPVNYGGIRGVTMPVSSLRYDPLSSVTMNRNHSNHIGGDGKSSASTTNVPVCSDGQVHQALSSLDPILETSHHYAAPDTVERDIQSLQNYDWSQNHNSFGDDFGSSAN